MAKIKYFAKENKKVGTHSFYGVPMPAGTLTFDEVCEEACANTTVEKSIMKAVVTEYIRTVQRNVLKGFRVPLGEQFITVYPNLSVSVRDTKDEKTGQVIVATAKMVTAANAKSRLGATVHTKFSQVFAQNVTWQKVDERTGAVIEEDDITDGSAPVAPGTSDAGSGGGSSTGSGSSTGGDGSEE